MTRSRSLSRGRPHSRSLVPETPVRRVHSSSPETTTSGIVRGRALYDTPSPGHEPPALGPRDRKQPEKYGQLSTTNVRARSHSAGPRRTQSRSGRRRAVSVSTTVRSRSSRSRSRVVSHRSHSIVTDAGVDADVSGAPFVPDSSNNLPAEPPAPRHRGRARIAQPSQPRATRGRAPRGRGGKARLSRQQDRSPTPGTSDLDPQELEPFRIATGETLAGSQHTFVYDTVNHDAFLDYASTTLDCPREKLENCGTENVVEMLRLREEDSSPKMVPSRRSSKIILLPHSVKHLNAAGWHHRRILSRRSRLDPSQEPAPLARKRRAPDHPDESDSGNVSKRPRPPSNDTATESESDDGAPQPPAAPVTPERIAAPLPRPTSTPLRPQTTPGTQAPPPTRLGTPITVLDSPPPSAEPSMSLGDNRPILPIASLGFPDLSLPLRDTAHGRLRIKAFERALDRYDQALRQEAEKQAREKEEERKREKKREKRKQKRERRKQRKRQTEGGTESGTETETEVEVEAEVEVERQVPGDESDVGELDERPGNMIGPRTYPKTPAPKRTYGHARSHAHSHIPTDESSSTDAAAPPVRPNSPSTDQAVLYSIELTRARLERAVRERESRAALPSRPVAPPPATPLFSPSSTRAQAGSVRSVLRARPQLNRRLDPISAARADIVAFNEEVARGNATSFVESATRANRRPNKEDLAARCGPMRDRSRNGLLEDDEEDLVQAQALAQGTYPKPARRRRNRKKKPLARDSTGLARQVLVLAKIHLFAYALSEGIYQTRTTFLKWAEEIHEKTWGILVPDQPYVAATSAELEVLVNYLATLRGKCKERARPLSVQVHGLNHRISSQEDIQDNLDIFHEVHPNSFHCKSTNPRQGHYESPNIARFIGACLGYGPTSVIVQFPEYFELMPITVVAFILALWQFCLEEWSNGYFQPRELSTAHMLDKFEAHLAGLKELRSVAPRRFQRLQEAWSQYVQDYTGATFIRTRNGQAVTDRSELRPDSPVPETADMDYDMEEYEAEEQRLVEECEDRMMSEARALSLASLEAYGRETRQFIDDYEDNLRAPTPHNVPSRAPSPTPAVEYNANGRLTARSKGKGPAK